MAAPKLSRITPCLWFDDEAEPAARHYVSIFPDSSIGAIAHYGHAGFEIHGRKPGSVMTVEFRLAGQSFTALNGGPQFKFSEAISFQVMCESQAEIDRYWARLTDGGSEGPCGWLRDRFGLSWQIVPTVIPVALTDPDVVKRDRVMAAVMQMKKIDLAAVERAYRG
jgi:predicted 3-demethylubiquinone-9 3-methyltransferase (glyoxalase superfamily)